MSKVNVAALMRRLNDQAHEQLCAEVARLGEENERLRHELIQMESCVEGWRDDAMSLHEQLAAASDGLRGITQSGELVVVAAESDPLSAEDAAWLDAWLAHGTTGSSGLFGEISSHG